MSNPRSTFVKGILLIFATYFYFLIFAQFAFLEIVRKVDSSELHLQKVMGTMAVGGLAGSFLVPFLLRRGLGLAPFMRISLSACALAGGLVYLRIVPLPGSAILIGIALGMMTVTLATSLRNITTESSWAIVSALGTGLAYMAANIPAIFRAPPEIQTLCATVISAGAIPLVPRIEEVRFSSSESRQANFRRVIFGIVFFGILVWFDSAAFYIIQHSGLKDGTWGNASDLWRNALVHLGAAIAAGFLMKRFQFFPTLAVAFVFLALGGMSANQAGSRVFSGWLYPAGVSIYSACLVAFPGFSNPRQALGGVTMTAAALFAISGWICSGLGIGMAQNLGRIPWQFIAVATALVCFSLAWTYLHKARRQLAYPIVILAAAAIAVKGLPTPVLVGDRAARGREIYISEGCIHCHSQFVKAGSRDELIWGPARDIREFAKEVPPLFGNRRQGPDLMNVGARRSREWLKLHFIAPRDLAPGSSMPSYEYLFADDRGEALLDYLVALKAESPRETAGWALNTNCPPPGNRERLFRQHCAMCHDTAGQSAKFAGISSFKRRPPNLVSGPFVFAPPNLPRDVREMQIARIIKFGITGTDMPGHEYLSDETVFALTRYVGQLSSTK